MKLYIGGCSQGKLEYALKTNNLRKNEVTIADENSFDFAGPVTVLNHMHLLVRQYMKSGHEPEMHLKQLLEKNPELIVICDEVGMGVVPIDPFEREYREKVGRICCELAKKADVVEQIICGMSRRIKG